jgi:glycerophosphoryl diester phosphodiesterase
LHVADNAVDREAIGKIHDAGMCAAAYTINSVDRAAALRAAGLDAVITDDPGKLLPALPADGA